MVLRLLKTKIIKNGEEIGSHSPFLFFLVDWD